MFKIFLKPHELYDYSNVYYLGINDGIKLSADYEQDEKVQVKKGTIKLNVSVWIRWIISIKMSLEFLLSFDFSSAVRSAGYVGYW